MRKVDYSWKNTPVDKPSFRNLGTLTGYSLSHSSFSSLLSRVKASNHLRLASTRHRFGLGLGLGFNPFSRRIT